MADPVGFLSSQQTAHPALAGWYAELARLYQQKLWHQLTGQLEQGIGEAEMQSGDALIQLYHNFIVEFETRLNLLKWAHLAVIVSRQYSEKESAVAFLESVAEKLHAEAKANGGGKQQERRVEEPVLYVKMQIAALQLQGGEQKECKKLLEDGKATLERLSDVDPSVHASVHWVSSQYYKAKQEFADFYKSALQYLAYTPLDTLGDAFKLDLSVDLSLAALLGERVFNFGELLTHPIVQVLEGTSCAWLFELLQTFDQGDLPRYDALCQKYAAQLNAQPALVENERRLREKMTILCLMECVSSRPSEERTIPLQVIAERTGLSLDGVELLLMKTLSVHLLEGVIDGVEGTVQVSWVQPRVLAPPQIAALRGRLDTWLGAVHSALLTVEAETPDLQQLLLGATSSGGLE
eukprot:TRINITY_DN13696_c0_g2_i1.p1 TRINITY_DN13696_c0_g2~~TRINITY_DN13696_c0_g2_i1.p1  ORF type:complete len:408 (-),score=103.97 TRINITY_DN13696_c0_g2_i1:697-1920(-)